MDKIGVVIQCHLVTGAEVAITLPHVMSVEEALAFVASEPQGEFRYWPDMPPRREGSKIVVEEDYYVLVLGSEEVRTLQALVRGEKAAGHMTNKLRAKNLIDVRCRLTPQGRRLLEKILCNQLQK